MTVPFFRIHNLRILNTLVSAVIGPGELIGVIGPNGSGKTVLAEVLRGERHDFRGEVLYGIDLRRIAYSAYSADSSFFHYSDFYYQQRYNTFDVADVETVEQYLQYDASDAYRCELFNSVLPEEILTEKILELSSGETRKVLLLKNLYKEADVYILDNPFSGLDQASMKMFADLFKKIPGRYGKTVILLVSDPPPNIEFTQTIRLEHSETETPVADGPMAPSVFFQCPPADFDTLFQMDSGDLKIGGRMLIRDLNWTIRKGEKWLLKGANGSGKSTLLSLLNADNPAAYRYDFYLFDRKRGSGESIWDIKSRIGFISSEIQLYFGGSRIVKDIILSGFSATMVLNRRMDEREEENYRSLVAMLNLARIENAFFGRLSSGEKKTVMIARALVKNPPVLILDEPFQDLDFERFRFLHSFLARCADEDRTVIQTVHRDQEILPGMNRLAGIENQELHLIR